MIDQESTIAAAWVQGVTTGMSWMNSELEFNGKERIFCAPEKLAITTDQYIDILRQYLKTDKTVAKMPLGLAVLISLKETFPCSDRKTPSKTP